METELELMSRIKREWGERIKAACTITPPRPSPDANFLAALVSLESNGWRYAQRFEPRVWKHLHDVAGGVTKSYGGVSLSGIESEQREIAKTSDYHRLHLDTDWAQLHGSILADGGDASIRQMATSFGLTQLMGYHTIDWPEIAPLDLLDGEINLKYGVKLLCWFIDRYHLELPRQSAELFRAWNTGSVDPSHATFDPGYIPNGLRRMGVYAGLA
jgi:hypothetical protein